MAAYISLNRLDEAGAVYQEALQRKFDIYVLHANHYLLAFLRNDPATMKSEADWAVGKAGVEDVFLALQADTAAYCGRLGEARELSQRAFDSARRSQEPETAAAWMATSALHDGLFGDSTSARAKAKVALAVSHGHDVDALAALSLALGGDAAGAEALASELNRDHPLDTIVQNHYLPEIRAELALQHGDAAKALDSLQAAAPYEMAQPNSNILILFPVYVRGPRLPPGPQRQCCRDGISEDRRPPQPYGQLAGRSASQVGPGARLRAHRRQGQKPHRLPGLPRPLEKCRPQCPHFAGS